MLTTKLVILRHGESQWNKENKFTGWVDVDLSDQGCIEAKYAGTILKNKGFIFDYGYTSVLKRAIHTLWFIIDKLDQPWLPIEKSWRLNERHYGALQGLNKIETVKKFGFNKVEQWRRSLNISPPKITDNNNIQFDYRYSHIDPKKIPNTESLALTIDRIRPYWNLNILPKIKNKKKIIIVAHGNSIRAIVTLLSNLNNEQEIFQLNIPTAIPLIYEFDNETNVINHYFLNEHT
ncbi:2,3-diphosphoglycerate-dependent phosphoglycerate mutase [Blochmannia endosymbiont of Camponotus (Colobopsis) obliquus]|uniref:2,3-diphosphoglycerate-dependent phosphoglycerate mutase n=1 Tax=Blochmannia endosymbiont of Camponotus (Colobopsis) obliquus TaxID=1505597 RepID=UPI00061A5ED2|nr:2,3-diphosphoglycerate-dependent phosphoglycerate mutase [Blochmannia endosymbiont of Camponotus (Colobopsis) obliquus]AKC60505.1 2,3-bisphosphoglycerate-dependent phosphoglycerate mutase [Blochmannia endosymbiont of Camponotus (Colobopsis) obliquus]